VRVEYGRNVGTSWEKILVLDGHTLLEPRNDKGLPSAAPTPGTASTHEYQTSVFEDVANRVGYKYPAAGCSIISVLARFWSGKATNTGGVSLPHPMEGLELFDGDGKLIADLSQGCQVYLPGGSTDQRGDTVADPVAVHEVQVRPGSYILRQTLPDGRQYEGCVTACSRWVTQVAIQRAPQVPVGADVRDPIGDVAVFMRREGVHRQDEVIEGARLALADGRNLLGDGRGAKLADQLVTDFTDPVAGIIGGHLLLQAMDWSKPDPRHARQLERLVRKLRKLVGRKHPDVEALSLRCGPAVATSRPFTAPPMFRHSWPLITDASFGREELAPPELWQRVHASLAYGALFVWAADEQTRLSHAEQLSRWMSSCSKSVVAEALSVDGPELRSVWQPRTRGGLGTLGMSSPPMTDDFLVSDYAFAGADNVRIAWAADELPGVVRAAARSAQVPQVVRAAAQRAQVPAAAAAALWTQQWASAQDDADEGGL